VRDFPEIADLVVLEITSAEASEVEFGEVEM
jgi:hypothetical protein